MRILLLTMYFAPDPAANSVIMTELAEELVELGHEITVLTTFPHYDTNRIWPEYRGKLLQKARHGDIDVYRTYLYVPQDKSGLGGRLLNYASFNALATLLGSIVRNHDLILAPSPPLTIGLSAYLLSLRHRIPYIYNVQDIYPDIAVRLGVLTNEKAIRFFERMERFVYRNAAAVTVLSDGFRRNLLAKEVPADKVHVIPNFIDVEFVKPLAKDNAFARQHGLHDKFVLMYAGNVGLSQGLETVLTAADQLRGEDEIRFLIVGNGAAKEQLVAAAQERQMRNIVFLPFQPRSRLPEMYAAADVSLVTLKENIGSESVPSKAYTIMASGRPLLAAVSKDAETKRLINRAQCGLWVPPETPAALASALMRLYEDAALRRRLGVNGRAHVSRHYTVETIARQYEQVFESILPGTFAASTSAVANKQL